MSKKKSYTRKASIEDLTDYVDVIRYEPSKITIGEQAPTPKELHRCFDVADVIEDGSGEIYVKVSTEMQGDTHYTDYLKQSDQTVHRLSMWWYFNGRRVTTKAIGSNEHVQVVGR